MTDHAQRSAGAHFSMSLPGGTSVPDVLAIWDTTVLPAPALAFVLDQGGDIPSARAGVITWRVDLPDDSLAAARILTAQIEQADTMRAALDRVDTRLNLFMRHTAPGDVVSFAASAPTPEQSLARLLQAASQPASSFALADPLRARLNAEMDSLREFLAQVNRMLDAYAVIETAAAERLIARTRVSWTGDFATAWRLDLTSTERAQHAHAVSLALTSRALWVRFAGHVLTGGLKLGRWLALPGGAVVALPALWSFINEILAEYRQIKQATGV